MWDIIDEVYVKYVQKMEIEESCLGALSMQFECFCYMLYPGVSKKPKVTSRAACDCTAQVTVL